MATKSFVDLKADPILAAAVAEDDVLMLHNRSENKEQGLDISEARTKLGGVADLTASRVMVVGTGGRPEASVITSTELGYLDDVTSSIQTQLNAKAPLSSPAFTNVPTAPTAAPGTNNTQIATTAYADASAAAAAAALVASAPSALNTLDELAAALADDANYASTITTALGGKLAASSNLSDLANAGTARTNLGLGTIATQAASSVAITGGAVDGVTIGATTPVQAQAHRPTNAQSGTTYTFVLGDADKLVTFNNAGSQTITVPPNASVAFSVNTEIDLISLGAGTVTIAAGSGVTIRSLSGALALSGQYAGATLKKIATNEWLLVGSLA